MKNKLFKSIETSFLVVIMTSMILACSDIFDKQPLDQVSDATFWKTESDATLALTGCYYTGGGGWRGEDFWTPRALLYLDLMAGDGSEKEGIPDMMTDGTVYSDYWVVNSYWKHAYEKIAACNNFMDHIENFQMDATKKEMYRAEVRTLRAYEYFNLALYYGDVPLATKSLSLDEANSISRTAKADVWSFCETELKESSAILPKTRPSDEIGRMTSGTALALLGRLQMAEKKWGDAAITYKKIIDQGIYEIDPLFNEIFTESGENSKEIIMRSCYLQDDYGHVMLQYLYPETWSGWHQFSPYNELVEDYECIDGKTINESPLYNEDKPYENRDPRMLYTVLIGGYSSFKGTVYNATPGSSSSDRYGKYSAWTGYCIRKFMDENFDGSLMNYGADFPIIRYAEVLLSYLESKLEAGEAINQTLLDATINKVRGRDCVKMPAVTETDQSKLRSIIRRERHIELAFEGVRYFDILRWGIAAQELNRQFHGMKLTTDPSNYTDFDVDENGYALAQKRNFKAGINELWPIPLSEIEINSNLTQNTGY